MLAAWRRVVRGFRVRPLLPCSVWCCCRAC